MELIFRNLINENLECDYIPVGNTLFTRRGFGSFFKFTPLYGHYAVPKTDACYYCTKTTEEDTRKSQWRYKL